MSPGFSPRNHGVDYNRSVNAFTFSLRRLADRTPRFLKKQRSKRAAPQEQISRFGHTYREGSYANRRASNGTRVPIHLVPGMCVCVPCPTVRQGAHTNHRGRNLNARLTAYPFRGRGMISEELPESSYSGSAGSLPWEAIGPKNTRFLLKGKDL
jgi:hypothetical protein